MIRTWTHENARQSVAKSLRAACKLLKRREIGGLNRTKGYHLSTYASTVASNQNHSVIMFVLQISSAARQKQLNANTSTNPQPSVTKRLRVNSKSNIKTQQQEVMDLTFDGNAWTAPLNATGESDEKEVRPRTVEHLSAQHFIRRDERVN